MDKETPRFRPDEDRTTPSDDRRDGRWDGSVSVVFYSNGVSMLKG